MLVHQTKLELITDVPPEAYAGASVSVKVRVSCLSGCDLTGAPIVFLHDDRIATSTPLVDHDGTASETADTALRIPEEIGSHAWRMVFDKQTIGGIAHAESSRSLLVTTRPHETSMAVWGQSGPVTRNDRFRVHVGVKCGLGCELSNHWVRVADECGVTMSESRLGDAPWPGTEHLYVAELPLLAPDSEGVTTWSATFDAIDLRVPHQPASASLGFRTVNPPDHIVTVKVIERETEAPVGDAQVHVGFYHGSTNDEGLVRLALPKDAYQIKVRKAGYECAPTPLDVTDDIVVHVIVRPAEQSDPDDEFWM